MSDQEQKEQEVQQYEQRLDVYILANKDRLMYLSTYSRTVIWDEATKSKQT